jgi:hypothetical protein
MIFNGVENGSTARVLNEKEDLSMTEICQLERFMNRSLLSLGDLVAIGFTGIGTTHLRQEYIRKEFRIGRERALVGKKTNLSGNCFNTLG